MKLVKNTEVKKEIKKVSTKKLKKLLEQFYLGWAKIQIERVC